MARLNAYTIIPSEAAPPEARVLVDPDKPNSPWPLTLRAVRDRPGRWAIQAAGGKYADDYIYGRPDPATGERGPVAPPLAVNGKRVALSPVLFQSIAALEAMQVPDPGDAPYTFEDFLIVAIEMPAAFDAAVEWASSLMTPAHKKTGDAVEDAKTNP